MNQLIEKPDKIFENIKTQIKIGVKNRNHDFHTPVFSNLKKNELIGSRVVVLRSFNSNELKINFHTDIRSKKIEELKAYPKTNFLFYDHKSKIQLRIQSTSKIFYNNNVTKFAWDQTRLSSRKCYLAQEPPSSKSIVSTDSIPRHLIGIDPSLEESEEGYKNFGIVSSQIESIDWLYLSSKGHRRLLIAVNNIKNSYKWLIP